MQPATFNLTIGVIKISMVENASAVNIGKNLLADWDSHSKSNQGLGNINGDSNTLEQLANHVEDPDKIDVYSPTEPESNSTQDLQQAIEAFFKDDL